MLLAEIDAFLLALLALFGGARPALDGALRHERDPQARSGGQGGPHREPEEPCRHRRRGRLRRARAQVPDLGADAFAAHLAEARAKVRELRKSWAPGRTRPGRRPERRDDGACRDAGRGRAGAACAGAAGGGARRARSRPRRRLRRRHLRRRRLHAGHPRREPPRPASSRIDRDPDAIAGGAGAGREGEGPARARARPASATSTRRRGGGLHRRRRRRRARHRRLVDAARRGRARLLLPPRRAARHAHGARRRQRRRPRQHAPRRPSSPTSSSISARSAARGRSPAPSIERRRKGRIETTGELAELVAGLVRAEPGGIHPATRVFQALRIAVNDELGELVRALHARRARAAPRRAARGRDLPLARGPHREAVPRRPHRPRARRSRATCRAARTRRPSFVAVTKGPVAAERGRGGAKPSRPLGEAARGRAHRRAGAGAARRARGARLPACPTKERGDDPLPQPRRRRSASSARPATPIRSSTRRSTRPSRSRSSRRASSSERDSIAVLKAEWQHLNRPDRLQAAVDRHLDLQPTAIHAARAALRPAEQGAEDRRDRAPAPGHDAARRDAEGEARGDPRTTGSTHAGER